MYLYARVQLKPKPIRVQSQVGCTLINIEYIYYSIFTRVKWVYIK